jgi:hypothetical protein
MHHLSVLVLQYDNDMSYAAMRKHCIGTTAQRPRNSTQSHGGCIK